MSLFQRKRLSLGIAADHLSLLHHLTSRQCQRLSLPEAPTFDSTSQGLLTALNQLLVKQPLKGHKVDVTVADYWARYWLVDPPANADSLAELKACTEERFKQLFGANPADWQILARWHPTHPFLAVALPVWLCDGLRKECDQHSITLRSCVPVFAQQWHQIQEQLPSSTWLCIEQASSLVIALAEKEELRHVRMLALPSSPSNDLLLSLLEQEVERCSVNTTFTIPEAALHLGPTQRWPQVDSSSLLRIRSKPVAKALEGEYPSPQSAETVMDGDWLALAGSTS